MRSIYPALGPQYRDDEWYRLDALWDTLGYAMI